MKKRHSPSLIGHKTMLHENHVTGDNDRTTKGNRSSNRLYKIIRHYYYRLFGPPSTRNAFFPMWFSNSMLLATIFIINIYIFKNLLKIKGNTVRIKIDLNNPPHPRIVGYILDGFNEPVLYHSKKLQLEQEKHRSSQPVQRMDLVHRSFGNMTSKDYFSIMSEPAIIGDCYPMHEWQATSFPSCNGVHEVGFNDLVGTNIKLMGNGFFRDVWNVDDEFVFKTLRFEHSFNLVNYDRHRRESLAQERLTSKNHVISIYSFCGNSAVFEYGNGGDIENFIWSHPKESQPTWIERLRVATQVAAGIAETHTSENNGLAAIAHTDISLGQFILTNGVYKLNDFNRCRLIRWNKKKQESCKYKVGRNAGKLRSPEEYEYAPQSEKVDVYSMGNIFYFLLTGVKAFEKTIKPKEAQKKVMAGERPLLSSEILSIKNETVKSLIKAMDMCFVHDQEQRPSAVDVYKFLSSKLKLIDT
mmetsp:Transcript_34931/g.42148  ORF Transcript_34931/g.42148 Transcript_34931/m.42148 type:complete len:470 (-) Transcript_34931:290-1699(-)